MELVYYRGLNCYLSSILSIAAALGVDYRMAFANLWGETDFTYDTQYEVYVSAKIIPNLSALGIELRVLDIGAEALSGNLEDVPEGGFLSVGMDTIHIPWHPVYGHFSGPHYFFVQKEGPGRFGCHDPIYRAEYTVEPQEAILSNAFDLISVTKSPVSAVEYTSKQAAEEALRVLPKLEKSILGKLPACKNKSHGPTRMLIKEVDALIINRRMFQQYLWYGSEVRGRQDLFSDAHISRWESVKNGLLKALIAKDGDSVIDLLCGMIQGLIADETAMAKEIASIGCTT